MSKPTENEEEYEGEEAKRRFEDALRGGFKTPPSPLKDKPKAPKPTPARKITPKKAIGLRGAERH
jgi:hypothetical protein